MFVVLVFWLPAEAKEHKAKTMATQTEKPVVTITFDDGSASIYNLGLPRLAKYKIPATIYLSTAYIGTEDDWYMSWESVKGLNNNGWEIASHGYHHYDLMGLDNDTINSELDQSKLLLATRGYNGVSFATPYGEYDNRVLDLIKQEFQSNRRAWDEIAGNEGFNDLRGYDKYNISAKSVHNNVSVSKVESLIDKAVKQKKWLVLLFHEIVSKNPQTYQYKASNLDSIMSYISQQQKRGKLRVQTMQGFLASH